MIDVDAVTTLADEGDFSGVVVVSEGGSRTFELARGLADRANGRPIEPDTVFGIASVSKALTALTVATLVEAGDVAGDTGVRTLLGDDLPLVDDAVTIEHLLGHTSGIGDYVDESLFTDTDQYVLGVPVHGLDSIPAYVPILDGYPQRTPPGTTFAYSNGAFVLLAVLVERASGRDFYELVTERVLEPAGMTQTGFFRSDLLPRGTAIGYLADGRSNILHLPVRGGGDGGAWSTARDLELLWDALWAGRIVSRETRDWLVAPRTTVSKRARYGLGFWLRGDRDTFVLQGLDAGISSWTAFDPASRTTAVVLANDADGAWPIARHLGAEIGRLPA